MFKGHNSAKMGSIFLKLELDLFPIDIKSYAKYQFKIWKGFWKKSGKHDLGRIDGRTDGHTDGRTDARTAP